MKSVIYVDENGDIRAKRDNNAVEIDAFIASLESNNILVLDGTVYPENVPEQHKTTFPIVLKSFTKVWATNRVLLEPKERYKVVEEENTNLVIEDAPKAIVKPKKTRKPRKKKTTTNE